MNLEKLQPYPKMKDFGIDWIGKTPEHWDGQYIQKAHPKENDLLLVKPGNTTGKINVERIILR